MVPSGLTSFEPLGATHYAVHPLFIDPTLEHRLRCRETGAMSILTGTRRIEFDGAHNFRDLGGYRSQLGGELRWGLVYRAGRIDQLTARDQDHFRSLGIRTVYDLRRDDERERFPDPVPNVHVCLMSRVFEHSAMPDTATFVDHHHSVQFLRELYVGLLTHAGREIGEIFTGMAQADALPVLFHCTAGKDRTGVVAALLLSWLGVDREVVLDDFELTEQYIGHELHEEMFQRMLERGMAPEAAAGMLHASRDTMAAALDELEVRYGGIERYLREMAGADSATLRALRERLIEY
jgi:protein-tyrosine phosphatase